MAGRKRNSGGAPGPRSTTSPTSGRGASRASGDSVRGDAHGELWRARGRLLRWDRVVPAH